MAKRVALALSSGGARGLAHIGVIDVLQERGYEITSLAGSSMGAIVGAMYAAGTLGDYERWIKGLSRMDVIRLVDFTLGANGFVKGEKIFTEMQKLGFIPDINIEDLPIPIVILATDIMNNTEVVFTKGKLEEALRASVSIPSVFTPIQKDDALWVDGGVLNPLPIKHLSKENADLLVAVDTNALIPFKSTRRKKKEKEESEVDKSTFEQLKERWYELFEGDEKKKLQKVHKLGYLDLMHRTMQVMMNSIIQTTLKEYPPDILIRLSKDISGVFEFYRAEEIIETGAEECRNVLDTYENNN